MNKNRSLVAKIDSAVGDRAVTGLAFLVGTVVVLRFALYETSWSEWGNAYWLLLQQKDSIEHTGLPSYFVSSAPSGIAYPHHVYYAGFLLTVMAYISFASSTWFVFCASLVCAYAFTMIGSYWLCALFTTRRVAALLSMIVVLSPYVITNLYGRGAWAETVGVGSGILLIGAIARFAHQFRFVPSALKSRFYCPTIAFAACATASTHNISLLITLATVMALFPVIFVEVSHVWRSYFIRQTLISMLLGLSVPAVFLIPNLATGMHTLISTWSIASATQAFDQLRVILWPVLYFPKEQTLAQASVYGEDVEVRLFAQTSLGLFALSVLSALYSFKYVFIRARRSWRVPYLFVGLIGLTVLMTQTTLWVSMPKAIRAIQFPYRLHPYLLVWSCVLLAVTLQQVVSYGQRFARLMICAVLLWTSLLASYQIMTAAKTTPSGYQVADHARLDAGQLPPVWRSGTAPPIQFRKVIHKPIESDPTHRLNFQSGGKISPTISVAVSVSPPQLESDFGPLVSFGPSGSADVFGIRAFEDSVFLSYDHWGSPPQVFVVSRSTKKDIKILFEYDTARSALTVSTEFGEPLRFNAVYGQHEPINIGRNLVGASTVSAHMSRSALVFSSIRRKDGQITPGVYLTNVVESEFVTFRGAKKVGSTRDGLVIINASSESPRWLTNRNPLVLSGLLVSFLSGLVILISTAAPLLNRLQARKLARASGKSEID